MATISDRLDKVENTMTVPAKKLALGNLLKNHAIKAMMKGIGSDEWKQYMSMFADNQEQLDRLTIAEENEGQWLRESRAYIVSNSVCATATNTRTRNGVDTAQLDGGLSTNEDAAIVNLRPADFTDLVE
jgi:hypothetical protein